MASEKILSKLSVGGEKDYYLLTTVHNGGKEGFDLSLCDGHEAWCGSGKCMGRTNSNMMLWSNNVFWRVLQHICMTSVAMLHHIWHLLKYR